MIESRSIRSFLRIILDNILSDRLYLKTSRFPFFGNKKRRGSPRNLNLGLGNFQASDPDRESIFFCIKRDFAPITSPVVYRFRTIAEKYQNDDSRVRNGDTVIDIGANIGEFSRAVQHVAGRVSAIEPDPIAFNCRCKNCLGYENISMRQIAISNNDGDGNFLGKKMLTPPSLS